MNLRLHRIIKIIILLVCVRIICLTAVVSAEAPALFVDNAAVSESAVITSGEHTITAEGEGDMVCIAVYEKNILKAVSMEKSLTYSFPEEGAVIKLFCWDSNMRPLYDAVRAMQQKPIMTPAPTPAVQTETLIYNGEAFCTPDEYLDFSEYIVHLTVVTEDGRITEIKDIAGYEKSGKATSSTNGQFLKNASSITKQIIRKQSTKVDAVSGATCASYAIMDAVDAALKSEPVTNSTPEPASTEKPVVADGTYRGSAQCITKNLNYMIDVDVTVKDGKITAVKDKTLRTPMSSKDEELYTKAWSGLHSSIIAKGNTADIDAVSGATVSSTGIADAVQNALDGREAAADADGTVYAPKGISLYSRVYPIVRVNDGKITDIRIVPSMNSDEESLNKLADDIKSKQSVKKAYKNGSDEESYSVATLIEQILYGEGVLDDE